MDDKETSPTLSSPAYGTAPGEQYEMSNGSPRFALHVARRDSVKDRIGNGAPLSGLSDSVLPGYLTLTERVLVFLEGHNA
jgi:hypothetical protein